MSERIALGVQEGLALVTDHSQLGEDRVFGEPLRDPVGEGQITAALDDAPAGCHVEPVARHALRPAGAPGGQRLEPFVIAQIADARPAVPQADGQGLRRHVEERPVVPVALDQKGQGLLAMLEQGDIGPGGDGPAVGCLVLADLHPAAVAQRLLDWLVGRVVVPCQEVLDEGFEFGALE